LIATGSLRATVAINNYKNGTFYNEQFRTSASKNEIQEVLLHPSLLETPHIIYNTT
jgi:hypothetical protein